MLNSLLMLLLSVPSSYAAETAAIPADKLKIKSTRAVTCADMRQNLEYVLDYVPSNGIQQSAKFGAISIRLHAYKEACGVLDQLLIDKIFTSN